MKNNLTKPELVWRKPLKIIHQIIHLSVYILKLTIIYTYIKPASFATFMSWGEKNKAFNLICQINKNGQVKTVAPTPPDI